MSEPKVLLDGLAIGESPRWHAGRLWFSNWGTGQVMAVDEAGKSEVMVQVPTSIPFCIDWLPDGRLLVVSGREGLVLRQETDRSLVTHADLTGLSKKPWNEILVDGRGNIYVNCIAFDFPGGEFAPGIVALITPDGKVRQVADGLAFPNGMVITADGKKLIVAESYAHQLTAFEIAADGSLSNKRVWASVVNSAPDGICLDAEGAVWYADVPNQACVRVKEGGKVLETVKVDRGCFACALGGADNHTLFIMAASWGGPAQMGKQAPTGQVLTTQALAASAGWA